MKKYLIMLIVALVVLFLSFVGGCQYHKKVLQSSVTTSDTIEIVDTSWHRIVDSLNQSLDSVNKLKQERIVIYTPSDPEIITKDVDTAAILKDHYSIYEYYKKWEDKDLKVELITTISENRPLIYDFSYNIKRAQTIISNTTDNSTTYNRYLIVGLEMPLRNMDYIQFEAKYISDKGYIGLGYNRHPNTKGLSVSAGTTLIKFKGRKK